MVSAHDRPERREDRRPGQDAARVVGCSRTSSHSSGRSGPGRSQTPWGRPPGRGRGRARRGRPAVGVDVADSAAAARASSATPREWPWKNGRLEVGRVAEPGERLVQVASSRNVAAAAGSASTTAAQRSSGPESSSSSRRRLEEDRGDRRVQGTARPAGDDLGGEIAAADRVEHDGGVADRGVPRRLRHSSPARPAGAPFPSNRSKAHSTAGRPPRAAAAAGQLGAHLAVGPRRLRHEPGDPGRARQHPQLLDARRRGRPGTASPRAGRVASIRSPRARTAMSSPPNARRSRARSPRSRRSASAWRSRRRPAGPSEPGPARQLGRHQARPHRLSRRMAAGQVAGHRQRGDHSGDADRLGTAQA